MARHLAAGRAGARTFLLTLTPPSGEAVSMATYNARAPGAFAALVRDLRVTMPGLEYARVLELMHQKRAGWIHIHAILTGWSYSSMEWVRGLVVAHGFGPRFRVEMVRSEGGVVGYVASRYLVKSRDMFARHTRVVQYSRGWAGPAPIERPADAPGVVAVVRDGMSWAAWADREIDRGSGSRQGDGLTGRGTWASENPVLWAAMVIFGEDVAGVPDDG
jgi:hypothetical protein